MANILEKLLAIPFARKERKKKLNLQTEQQSSERGENDIRLNANINAGINRENIKTLELEDFSDCINHISSEHLVLCIGDITKFPGDAIVNAANTTLLGGGGVDGAIHWAAGYELYEECKTLGGCKTGAAKITKGYNLKAKHIIHTVGPIYESEIADQQAKVLESCYRESLNLARENDIHSIAFPCISTGVYGYPHDKAAEIAYDAVKKWQSDNIDYKMEIVFVCFQKKDYDYYRRLYLDKSN